MSKKVIPKDGRKLPEENYPQFTLAPEQIEILATCVAEKLAEIMKQKEDEKIKRSFNQAVTERIDRSVHLEMMRQNTPDG